MSEKEYHLIKNICSRNSNENNYKPLISELIEHKTNPFKDLYDIIVKCLNFNPATRPNTNILMSRIKDLDDLTVEYSNRYYKQPLLNIPSAKTKGMYIFIIYRTIK